MSEVERRSPGVSRVASFVLAVVFVLGLLHLGVRLREVQVDEAASYGYASSRQSVRRVQVGGSRGRILDRHGRPLAENRNSLSIICRPAFFQKRTWEGTVREIAQAITNVAQVIGVPSPVEGAMIRRHVRQSLAMPLFAWRDIDETVLARFAEHACDLPGFAIEETEARIYPQGAMAAHLLGYVGRDRGEDEAGDEKFNFYAMELRGRSGLEFYYDGFLRGVPGERKLLVDARGFAIRDWMVVEPQAGPDLQLTLDSGLQRVVERQLQGERGACVVLDPRTGEILAMASAPNYNPNAFVPFLRRDLYARYTEDPAKPLLNRAVAGGYAPGSTFKPITALTALSLGYPENAEYMCEGFFELGEMRLRCARRWGHGELDIRHALMKSCNPFFCNLGMEVGTNALVNAAHAFGLGEKTGIDLSVDGAGVVPDGEWKMRTYGEPWYQGDLVQMSIGQGMLLVSPLQMALVAGALGTGYRVMPRLKAGLPVNRRPLPFSAKHLDVVRDGMRLVVAGEGAEHGGGWRGGDGVAVPIAGKTGTAEVGRGINRRKNAWFIAYAPAVKPTLAVALVIENGEAGGSTAAPRVAAILRHVFGTSQPTTRNTRLSQS